MYTPDPLIWSLLLTCIQPFRPNSSLEVRIQAFINLFKNLCYLESLNKFMPMDVGADRATVVIKFRQKG